MEIKIKTYDQLPEEAKQIRIDVFIKEQKFENEFDEIDGKAVHLLAYDGNLPVGTARIYKEDHDELYHVGRLAVIREYRGKNVGADLLGTVSDYVKAAGGAGMELSSQKRAEVFYQKQGYQTVGGIYYDEYCPHVRMIKRFETV